MEKPVALNRPRYRAGNKETAVKAYTINQESRFLIVKNVPALGTVDDLLKLFALYGEIEEYRHLDEEETPEFTDAYWVKFKDIASSRVAKKKCDDYNFFGHLLDVSYAPKFETVNDMREKLEERKRIVAYKIRQNYNEARQKIKEEKPGRVSHDDMPFEPPPDFAPTKMEELPAPQFRTSNPQLYNQTGRTGNPRATVNTTTNTNSNTNPNTKPGFHREKPSRSIPLPDGIGIVDTYYGDSSVHSSVMSIRNKLRKISAPETAIGTTAPETQPSQKRRRI